MMTIREYKRVESLEEAWELNQKKANRVIGGMIWLKMSRGNVGTAIDISGLGLDQIEETEDTFEIGAMVTLRQLEEHPGLAAYTDGAMRESVRHIVGVQLRQKSQAPPASPVPEAPEAAGFGNPPRWCNNRRHCPVSPRVHRFLLRRNTYRPSSAGNISFPADIPPGCAPARFLRAWSGHPRSEVHCP